MTIYRLDKLIPQIDETAFIAPSASIIGDVLIGSGSSVWFNAVLRGDDAPIRIGNNSNIQDGCVVHLDPDYPCIIGDYCTIGHAAIVHGATLSNHVLVGMGATVMNGVVLGEGCVVGAGALVPEGKTFEPYSLIVGIPGRCIRTLEPQTRSLREEQALRYARRGLAYATKLHPTK